MTLREEAQTTLDHVLGGRLALRQPARGHRVGHDAILLAALGPAGCRHMVDLGAGVGSAGLAFLTRCPQARGALVELNPDMAALAGENIALNAMERRCAVIAGDVRHVAHPGGIGPELAGQADLVLMNPPYNMETRHRTSPHAGRALAHAAGDGLLVEWVKAASRCLAPQGILCLIHRPQDIAALLAALAGRFGAVELLPVHARPGLPAMRLLVRAIKERRTAPVIHPGLLLADENGAPHIQAQQVLREAAPLLPQR
ncbi:tRNA1(Val) (adenine(37)-N6)-methyltransferase [Xanthobacter sp. TB0136]|uniref:tRNA1(Val) (adenine(37)-N6)-methyltransferase n=1 Tax=Xanthobacter sp. TB0136 TaxID=3459177 RepID=UPI00403A4A1B